MFLFYVCSLLYKGQFKIIIIKKRHLFSEISTNSIKEEFKKNLRKNETHKKERKIFKYTRTKNFFFHFVEIFQTNFNLGILRELFFIFYKTEDKSV
jgi:protoheme ferro-lyase